MANQFYPESPGFKLSFSNINCNINLEDFGILALAVKIGKNYSKFTHKSQLKSGKVLFTETLSIPVEQELVFDKNPRKQKCEVMLYRYQVEGQNKHGLISEIKQGPILSTQKQQKNLIGMGSVSIDGDLFEQRIIKLRITNRFDKDAYISCNIKICHDIFQNNRQRISSIGSQSCASSACGANYNKKTVQMNYNSRINWVQNQQDSKSKDIQLLDLNISCLTDQKKPTPSKQSGSYSQRQMLNNGKYKEIAKTQRIFIPKKSEFLGKIKRNQTNSKSTYSQNQEKKDFKSPSNQQTLQLCTNLKDQNALLMNKLAYLQNHILNQKQTTHFSNKSSPKIVTSPTLAKSSMIKKNNQFITSVSTTLSKRSDQPTNNQEWEKKKEQQLIQVQNRTSNKTQQSHKMVSIHQMDQELQCSKSFTQKSQCRQKLSFKTDQNLLIDLPQYKQTKKQTLRSFTINPVLEVAYIPPIRYFGGQKSRMQKQICPQRENSVARSEKSIARSYKKFNGKSRQIGANMTKNNFLTQSFINQAQQTNMPLQTSSANIPLQSSIDTQNSMTIKQSPNSEMPLIVTITQARSPNKLLHQTKDKFSEKSTLQNVNKLIEQKYRKPQNFLKKANQKIIQQNKTLKKQKQRIENELQQKKLFSAEQFRKLQQETTNQQSQINYYMKFMQQKQSEVQVLIQRLQQSEDQNQKLKRDLKQQKETASYFIKASNIKDQNQKEMQLQIKFTEQQQKLASDTLSQTQLHSSNIHFQSPKVLYHPSQKQTQYLSYLSHQTEQKGYKTQRSERPQMTVFEKVPNLRLSVSKMIQRQNHQTGFISHLSHVAKCNRQQSVSLKGLLGHKQHSDLNTKQTNEFHKDCGHFEANFLSSIPGQSSITVKQNHLYYTQRRSSPTVQHKV